MLYRRQYIFWSDVNNNRLVRSYMNGSDIVTLVDTDLCNPCMFVDLMLHVILDNKCGVNGTFCIIE